MSGGGRFNRWSIPVAPGIGFRIAHTADVLAAPQSVAWIEVHAENYLAPGGERRATLERLRQDLPLSIHGVGLSLGSDGGVDPEHLARVTALVEHYEPGLVSEHVAWSVAGGVYYNDLLPVPYTAEALTVVADNIGRVQDSLRRQIIVENPSRYLSFADDVMPESAFLAELVRCAGCGLLLDLNNLYISSVNVGIDAGAELDAIARLPKGTVQEIHLAGYDQAGAGNTEPLLIDTHASAIADPVWSLYETALQRLGPVPTLVEWDQRLPVFDTLLAEAAKVAARMERAVPTRPICA